MVKKVEGTQHSLLRFALYGALVSLIAVFCLAGSTQYAFADTADAGNASSEETSVPNTGNAGAGSDDATDPNGSGDPANTPANPNDENDSSNGSSDNTSGNTSGDVSQPSTNKPATGEQTTPVQTPEKQKPEKKPTKAGWLQDTDGTWYYFTNPDAKPSTGWLKSGGKWYWLQPDKNGAMAVNTWITDQGKRYYFTGSGAMATKWIKIGNDWYYANKSGAQVANGWIKSGSKWYWLQGDKDGAMAVNTWITDQGKRYYLTASGAMATKWIKIGNDWYYANKSGAQVANGWIKSGSKWYWLQGDKQGLMLKSDMKVIDGAQYSFGGNGAMRANCQVKLENGAAGYAASSGAISRIGEYRDGKLVLTNAQGQILTGWQKLAGKWFYGEPGTGIAQTGWLKLGSTWYYLDSNAAMVTGTKTIDGKAHIFTGSGKWLGTDAMVSKAQGYSSGTPWLILVDRDAHKVGVFHGSKGNWNRERAFACVTGAPGSPTITGVYRTTGAKRMNLSTDSRARWCTQISGGYFFHTILASNGELGQSLSHGCLRLAVPDAQWIYNNIGGGTTVVIYN